MKLLDVLAKEMKEWPEGGYSVGQATDGTLHVNNKHNKRTLHICVKHKGDDMKGLVFYDKDGEVAAHHVDGSGWQLVTKDGFIVIYSDL